MATLSPDPDFPYDANGVAATFAAAILQLAANGRVELAQALQLANRVTITTSEPRADHYQLHLALHPKERELVESNLPEVTEALTQSGGYDWQVITTQVHEDLVRVLRDLNEELDRQGLPRVLDVRFRERPGGGRHHVAVHSTGTETVHRSAIDDFLFHIGRRQTAWTELALVGDPIGAVAPALEHAGAGNDEASPVVFISYSVEDEQYLLELRKHLAHINRTDANVWTFRQTAGGTSHHAAIAEHLQRAQIGVLLVSANFLASDYIADVELPGLSDTDTTILPVIAGACDHGHLVRDVYVPWGLTPLNTLERPARDAVYTSVATEIRRLLASST